MKIAMIIRRLDVKGGTQRQALVLADGLRRRGHEIKFYAFFYSKDRCYPDLLGNFEVVSLPAEINRPPAYPHLAKIPFLRYLDTLFTIRHETKSAKALAFCIDRDVDLLNPHDRVAHRTAYFFKKYVKPVPSVWNTNDTHSMRWAVDKLSDVDPQYRQPFWKRIGYRLRDWYENFFFVRTQNIIVTNDQFNQSLIKKYFGREAVVVRNGPDLQYFSYRKHVPPQNAVTMLTSGIFFPHRRFEDAIEAVGILRGWGYEAKLNIIGDPDSDRAYAEKLNRFVAGRSLGPFVSFLGKVREDDLIRYYHENDVYLYPHHLQSNGLAPVEALACGMPVVISSSAGVHEIITDRKTGLLVKPKDPLGIAASVRELIDNPILYEALSRNGAELVLHNFSRERYAQDMIAVYQSVLQATSP